MPENTTATLSELLEQKKYKDIRLALAELNPADVAELIGEANEEQTTILFRLLPKELAADTFAYLDSDDQELIISAFSDRELKEVIDELYLDDMADMVDEMPAGVVKRILKQIPADRRRQLNELLRYPDSSAGSIMTKEYIDLKKSMSVSAAFDYIRRTGVDSETIYTCYVTDASRRLIGYVTVKDLLLAEQDALIDDVMDSSVIFAHTLDDREDVALQFNHYDLMALPVVDREERLVGIITVDDAMQVLQEENTEDFAKMAAINPSDDEYLKTSVWRHAFNRLPWLLFLMISAMLSGAIITSYEETFAAFPLLIAFLPMLMGAGGNCGAQSSTLTIRGLAIDEIEPSDYLSLLWKELRVALVVGAVLSAIDIAWITLFYHDLRVALILAATLIIIVILAKAIGCSLPVLAKLVHLDPAIMASPVLTTIVDACSVLIYFAIATKVLRI